jgi:hypothetical protein
MTKSLEQNFHASNETPQHGSNLGPIFFPSNYYFILILPPCSSWCFHRFPMMFPSCFSSSQCSSQNAPKSPTLFLPYFGSESWTFRIFKIGPKGKTSKLIYILGFATLRQMACHTKKKATWSSSDIFLPWYWEGSESKTHRFQVFQKHQNEKTIGFSYLKKKISQ